MTYAKQVTPLADLAKASVSLGLGMDETEADLALKRRIEDDVAVMSWLLGTNPRLHAVLLGVLQPHINAARQEVVYLLPQWKPVYESERVPGPLSKIAMAVFGLFGLVAAFVVNMLVDASEIVITYGNSATVGVASAVDTLVVQILIYAAGLAIGLLCGMVWPTYRTRDRLIGYEIEYVEHVSQAGTAVPKQREAA